MFKEVSNDEFSGKENPFEEKTKQSIKNLENQYSILLNRIDEDISKKQIELTLTLTKLEKDIYEIKDIKYQIFTRMACFLEYLPL